MNENAKKWVEALRSGEYKQARGALRRDDTFCCLGVACELYRVEVGGEWQGDLSDLPAFVASECRDSGILPSPVKDWLGLRTHAGDLDDGNDCLSGRNDDGATFAEIATLIESEPEGLLA